VAYEMVIRGARVVDPGAGLDASADVAIEGGRVARVEARGLGSIRAHLEIDATGLVLMPGIIDAHVHLADSRRGGIGHRRLALAGVTTAVEFADFDAMVADLAADGAGLNLAGLGVVGPYLDPVVDEAQILQDTTRIVDGGALGIKLFGGHYPSTPEATRAAIRVANEFGCYVAYHVGTTDSSSNLEGLRELPELLDGYRMHLAHVNAYLRGMTTDLHRELAEGFDILRGLPGIISESHLAPYNGASGAVASGRPIDEVTNNCLRMAGYPDDLDGLESALRDGYAAVNVLEEDRMVRLTGMDALAEWRRLGGDCGLSFPVNRRTTALACAIETRSGGEGVDREFLVDALASDGGAWRNELLLRGIPLVQFGALSLAELVAKISYNPARMFGFERKGHLRPGADADITLVDPEKRIARATIVSGQIIARDGRVMGRGGRLYTTDRGQDGLSALPFPVETVDLETSLFYRK